MITVVIPAYNLEKYICDCLKSICEQSYKDYEVIIINDGSQDKTQYVIEDFLRRNRLSNFYLYNITNSGVTAARKEGVNKSNGEWIVFVDGDDCLPPNALSDYAKAVSDNVNIVVSSYCRFNSSTFAKIPVGHTFGNRILSHEEYIDYFLNGNVEGAPWAKMFRRSLLTSYVFDIPSDIRNKEDILMNYRVACTQYGNVRFIPNCNYLYRWMREGSALTRFLGEKNKIQYELNIIRRIEEVFDNNNLYLKHISGFAYLYYDILYCQRRNLIKLREKDDVIKVKNMMKVVNQHMKKGDVEWKRIIKVAYLNLLIRFL